MSKAKEVKYEEVLKENNKPSMEESIEILTTQVKDYAEREEYFKVMKIKAQGALEVLSQLVDKKEPETK
tara:strand:- start:294 stop:500 length:207 start_codon:yes stop_codon:yes gene_type:complete